MGPARRTARAARNLLLLSLPSLLLLALALELLAGSLLNASDYPGTYFDPGLGNRYLPNQRGTFVADEIHARFRINDAGWNSRRDYLQAEAPAAQRVAVVGDSFIEALQVDFDRSYPALLEDHLNRIGPGPPWEVYSFGMSGANLVQYAYVLDEVRSVHTPDVVILNIVANDFAESLYGLGRADNWTLQPTDAGLEPVAPRPASNLRWKQLLRHSALARYLVINQRLPQKLHFVRSLFYGDVRNFEANVDVAGLDPLADSRDLERLLRDILGRYRAAAAGAELYIVLDANRGDLYHEGERRPSKIRPMFAAIARLAREQGIGVLDLTQPFREAYQRDGARFEFQHDGHWNAHAHAVVAEAVAIWLAPAIRGISQSEIRPDPRGERMVSSPTVHRARALTRIPGGRS